MKINRALNLVIPIDTEIYGQIYVHSTPISRDVFERFYLVISKTFAAIFSQGLGAIAGPRVAYLMLKQTAKDMGVWGGEGETEDARLAGVEFGLMNEIRRLTNVLVPSSSGWIAKPLPDLCSRNEIDAETQAEIEGELVFFTCVSMMNKRAQVPGIMEAVGGLWGSETSPLSCTEFGSSLPILTVTENSGETAITSSLPG